MAAPKPRTSGIPRVRTPALARKVKKAISGRNPDTQTAIARKHGVSQTTVGRIIAQDLQAKLRKKRRVHALSNAQVFQRLQRGPRFLRYINGTKWRNVLTIDEAWVYLTHTNGIRKIYYEFRGERTEESWTKFWKESHPKGVMFVAGVCSRGKTAMRFVEPGAKINTTYYIENVLSRFLKKTSRRSFQGG